MLGDNIKDLRKRKNLTQSEFAKIMNVSQQTIGAWESGRAIPGSDTLRTIADYFNVSTDSLLNRQISFDLADDSVVMSFDGQPLDEHDRKLLRDIARSIRANKE
ncbi:helix-turn-helix transcriptional regulator [Limosilactobacillus oris]|jgi:transcriptional regulator with XRE-family HTH domain|uniref:helix-turn-helix transcriptional regulator n=1 Tax=Limosilactobacillus oris TaxID=1632 RepID=UPI0022359E84|nr:helix-turn-helix transcriptional regulator [Limosilactobacillus oris]MCW4387042.1 helix-turn-helix domain-containing protein [Limosilactobacillus oris]